MHCGLNFRQVTSGVLMTFLFPVLTFAQYFQAVLPTQSGQTLYENLITDYKAPVVLSYSDARDVLYSQVYRVSDSVRCVYSGYTLHLPADVDPSTYLSSGNTAVGINCEHTFPQSKGAEHGNARSDMHHLFPVRAGVNSARGNNPYAEVADDKTQTWHYKGQELHQIPPNNIRNQCSEAGEGLFEPREDHKGNAARAMFYFYTMYRAEADAADAVFFAQQRKTLCDWHFLDAVDSLEWARTFLIATYQGDKPNPFVLDCSVAARMYCPESQAPCVDISTDVQVLAPQLLDISVFPNPAYGVTNLRFEMPTDGMVKIDLVSAIGQAVQTLYEEQRTAGEQHFQVVNNSSGLWFLRITITTSKGISQVVRPVVFE